MCIFHWKFQVNTYLQGKIPLSQEIEIKKLFKKNNFPDVTNSISGQKKELQSHRAKGSEFQFIFSLILDAKLNVYIIFSN